MVGRGVGLVHTFDLKENSLKSTSPAEADLSKISMPELLKLLDAEPDSKSFLSGLCLDEKERRCIRSISITGI